MTRHFGSRHPLVDVAARLCDAHYARLGADEIACGACWETAIRNDERIAVEFDLPAAAGGDADHIDEIAVERAAGGERVSLTTAELHAAAALLNRRRAHPIEIGRRLHITYRGAVAALAASAHSGGAEGRQPHVA